MKKWWKRGLAFGLALSLAAGLCACGKNGGGKSGAELAKEGVYKLQSFDIPKVEGDDSGFLASVHRDGSIYMLMQVYHWTDEKWNNAQDIQMLSMKTDGSNAKMIQMEVPEWESKLGSGDGNSGISTLPQAKQAGEAAAQTETEAGSEEAVSDDVWENSSYGSFCFGADGKIYAIRSYNFENYTQGISLQEQYFASWTMDGSFLGEKKLEGFTEEEGEYFYVNRMSIAADGTATLLISGSGAYKATLDPQGNLSGKQFLSEEVSKKLESSDRIVDKGDGTFLLLYYDENDWTKVSLVSYDLAKDTLGEPSQLPANFAYGGYNNVSAGISSDLICSNNEGVYTFKTGDTDFTQMMSFVNSDMYTSEFASLVELDKSSFFAVYYEDSENKREMKAGMFTKVDPKDIPNKTALVMAGNWINGSLRKRVIDFNRASDKYRIVTKSYESYNTNEDWKAGYTQLNNDIISGNMPDILITQGLPVENYVSKGLLEDIGKLIEKDEELSKTEFVQNVFDAYSVKGKLYYVIPNFYVSTMIAKQSVVGDRTSWTMDEMLKLRESLPEGTNILGGITRGDFFRVAMEFCGSDFVDVETGKCEFDTPGFISLMEFAKTLPVDTAGFSGEDYWANYESQFRDNKTLLCQMTISDIRDGSYYINGYFGGDVAFIGFPTESGKGAYLQPGESYAISSKSRGKEGAWEFLRYYLTDEYQSGGSFWSLPIQKKAFDKKIEEGTKKPSYTDENGQEVEYDQYFTINGESIVLDPLTKEQVDRIEAFILSVDKAYYSNDDVINIINEEMDAFYTGQKTAQEVAKVIQSRAQVYVDTNR